jgi:hypothetical protein
MMEAMRESFVSINTKGSEATYSDGVHVISIKRDKERSPTALFQQRLHHRKRRLHALKLDQTHRGNIVSKKDIDRADRFNEPETSDQHQEWIRSFDWRQSLASATQLHGSRRAVESSSNDTAGSVESVGISNCHLILWTGTITLGTPPVRSHLNNLCIHC